MLYARDKDLYVNRIYIWWSFKMDTYLAYLKTAMSLCGDCNIALDKQYKKATIIMQCIHQNKYGWKCFNFMNFPPAHYVSRSAMSAYDLKANILEKTSTDSK